DTRNAELQTAATIDGTWTRVIEGTNKFEIPSTGTHQFLRSYSPEQFLDPCLALVPGTLCKRNILLVIADDVGVDQLQKYISYYGNPARPSANRITSNGVRTDTI